MKNTAITSLSPMSLGAISHGSHNTVELSASKKQVLPYIAQNVPEYVDIYITINAGGQSDWKFVVSLDKESGDIYEADPLYSPSHDIEYDVMENDPPQNILDAFHLQRPEAIRLLAEVAEKENLPFNYEVEQEDSLSASCAM